jgi:hypothetical protein
MSALFSSKYSIHDLSRCTGEGDERLARFNMPLELGMAMAFRYVAKVEQQKHDWLVLVPHGHGHFRFVSDLVAFDLGAHDGKVETVVRKVMSWLTTRDVPIRAPTPPQVFDALPAFVAKLRTLEQEWGDRENVPWRRVLEVAVENVPRL